MHQYASLMHTFSKAGATRRRHRVTVPAADDVLYHCTAGKDRTGVFTALLLSWLGVPRAISEEDYLLSNAAAPSASEIAGYAKRSASARSGALSELQYT
jgi:hypothetical protein